MITLQQEKVQDAETHVKKELAKAHGAEKEEDEEEERALKQEVSCCGLPVLIAKTLRYVVKAEEVKGVSEGHEQVKTEAEMPAEGGEAETITEAENEAVEAEKGIEGCSHPAATAAFLKLRRRTPNHTGKLVSNRCRF
eukprot:GHVS01094353.1.p1 GENE.GHVS01094353.1~~GHVS01094353.1.p1  ORF type:complete len:138 (-),score=24.45 GHVS01094353.1:153-566(-)